jgi:hypothetical protein
VGVDAGGEEGEVEEVEEEADEEEEEDEEVEWEDEAGIQCEREEERKVGGRRSSGMELELGSR